MTCLKNITLYDYNTFIKCGYIIFDEKIIEVGSMEDWHDQCDAIDMQGMVLIPGLINCHTHIYSTLFRGFDMGVAPETFKAVLDEIWWRFDKHLTLDDLVYSAKVYAVESYKNGVTSLIDHHASGAIQGSINVLNDTLTDMRMKHLLCFEASDRFDLEECIAENRLALDLGGHFGLHASLSLSDESLNLIHENLGGNPVHIHVAEALVDEEDSVFKYGLRVVERLDENHLLNENSILAHCIHIDEKEAEIISKKGCYIALNTTSNLNNAVGLYDYDLIKKYNIPVIVGTDGLGSNVAKEYQSLYYVGKQGRKNPSGVDFMWIKDVLLESYNYFSKMTGKPVGRLQEGYLSDFLVVDYKAPTPLESNTIFGHVFYGVFENLKPRHVFVEGKRVISDYDYTGEEFMKPEIAEILWTRIGGEV